MEIHEYNDTIRKLARKIYVPVKDLMRDFPFSEWQNEDEDALEDAVYDLNQIMEEEFEQSCANDDLCMHDEPLHDWEHVPIYVPESFEEGPDW